MLSSKCAHMVIEIKHCILTGIALGFDVDNTMYYFI